MNDSRRIVDLLTKGESFCLVTITASPHPDIPPGGKLLVRQDGTTEGGVGSVALEATLRALAMEALREKKKRTVELDDQVRAFLDIFSTDCQLLICGAGHIAVPLARFACEVGFRVTVLDDRPDFAHPERFPGCQVIAKSFVPALREQPLGTSTYVVVITRGHEHDVECLQEILPKETAYVGLIGSRRRVRFVLEILSQANIPRERLGDVFAPIGLPIGSASPEEIALSIAAELVCLRRQGPLKARALRAAPGGEA